jgi:hypothetical protein
MIEDDEIDKRSHSKSERNALWILNRIHKHNSASGGVFSLITGSQGAGKTGVMLSFINYTLKHFSKERIFFSSCYNAPLQFTKLPLNKINIMVLDGSGVTFHDRNNHLVEIKPRVTYFKDLPDLWNKSKPGMVNCVFFGDRTQWIELIHYLREVGEWVHVYIDELSEICPAFTSGEMFKRIGDFSLDCKEIRKCQMCVHTNTQATQDIDHRVLTKIMLNIFLPGSHKAKFSRILQSVLDNLLEDNKHGNEGYVEYSGKFGKTVFEDVYEPTDISWEAKINDRK